MFCIHIYVIFVMVTFRHLSRDGHIEHNNYNPSKISIMDEMIMYYYYFRTYIIKFYTLMNN